MKPQGIRSWSWVLPIAGFLGFAVSAVVSLLVASTTFRAIPSDDTASAIATALMKWGVAWAATNVTLLALIVTAIHVIQNASVDRRSRTFAIVSPVGIWLIVVGIGAALSTADVDMTFGPKMTDETTAASLAARTVVNRFTNALMLLAVMYVVAGFTIVVHRVSMGGAAGSRTWETQASGATS